MKLTEITYASNHPWWMKLSFGAVVTTLCAVTFGLLGPQIAKLNIFDAATLGVLFGIIIAQDILRGFETRRLRRIIHDAGLDERLNH